MPPLLQTPSLPLAFPKILWKEERDEVVPRVGDLPPVPGRGGTEREREKDTRNSFPFLLRLPSPPSRRGGGEEGKRRKRSNKEEILLIPPNVRRCPDLHTASLHPPPPSLGLPAAEEKKRKRRRRKQYFQRQLDNATDFTVCYTVCGGKIQALSVSQGSFPIPMGHIVRIPRIQSL